MEFLLEIFKHIDCLLRIGFLCYRLVYSSNIQLLPTRWEQSHLQGLLESEMKIYYSIYNSFQVVLLINIMFTEMECIFRIFVVSLAIHAELGQNDHHEDASHFTVTSR